jgi:hypothetical protein
MRLSGGPNCRPFESKIGGEVVVVWDEDLG